MKRVFVLLFCSTFCWADCNRIGDVISQIRPGDQWAIRNNDFSTLIWLSTTTPPTLAEINTGIADCPNQINLAQRSTAINDLLTGTDDRNKLERAILLTILDQINTLRTQLSLTTVTPAQAKTAVQNKINSGASD